MKLLFSLIIAGFVLTPLAYARKKQSEDKNYVVVSHQKLAGASNRKVNSNHINYKILLFNKAAVVVKEQTVRFLIEEKDSNLGHNKSIWGVINYDETLVQNFQSFGYQNEVVSGGSNPDSVVFIEAIVDLYCDDEEIVVLTAEPQIALPGIQDSKNYVSYLITLDARVWRNRQRIIKDSMIVIPSEQDSYFESLLNLVLAYPDACFTSRPVVHEGLPENENLPSFLISVGKIDAQEKAEAIIKKVSINGKKSAMKESL